MAAPAPAPGRAGVACALPRWRVRPRSRGTRGGWPRRSGRARGLIAVARRTHEGDARGACEAVIAVPRPPVRTVARRADHPSVTHAGCEQRRLEAAALESPRGPPRAPRRPAPGRAARGVDGGADHELGDAGQQRGDEGVGVAQVPTRPPHGVGADERRLVSELVERVAERRPGSRSGSRSGRRGLLGELGEHVEERGRAEQCARPARTGGSGRARGARPARAARGTRGAPRRGRRGRAGPRPSPGNPPSPPRSEGANVTGPQR